MPFDPNDVPWWAQSFAPPQGLGVDGSQGFGPPDVAAGSTTPNDWVSAANAALAPFAQTQNPFDPGFGGSQTSPTAWAPAVSAGAFGNFGLALPVIPPLSFPLGFGTGGILGSLAKSDFGTGGLLGSLATLGQSSSPSRTGYPLANSFGPPSNSSPFGNPPQSPWDIPPSSPWSLLPSAAQSFGGAPDYASLNPPQTAPAFSDTQFGTSLGWAPPQLGRQQADPSSVSSPQYGTPLAGERAQSRDQSFQASPSPVDWASWPAMSSVVNGPALDSFDLPGRARVLLAAGEREEADPEDFLDPIAAVRTRLYNSLRYDLRNLQPNNYKLSEGSLRTPGGAPTIDEIGQLRYALGVAQVTQPLSEQAMRIFRLLDDRAQAHRTVAVLRTSAGTFVAGSGVAGLDENQEKAAAAEGLIVVPALGEGVHAEIALLRYTEALGRPQFIAASRPFCSVICPRAIAGAGGYPMSPNTAIFPRNIRAATFPPR